MKIRILAVGNKMPSWVSETYKNYNQRLTKNQQVELLEIPPVLRNKTTNSTKAKALEAETEVKEARKAAAVAPVAEEVTEEAEAASDTEASNEEE